MAYDIQFNLPDGWIKEQENHDDSGFEITHLEAVTVSDTVERNLRIRL